MVKLKNLKFVSEKNPIKMETRVSVHPTSGLIHSIQIWDWDDWDVGWDLGFHRVRFDLFVCRIRLLTLLTVDYSL